MSDFTCSRCEDSGYITVRSRLPMSYVGPGAPPDDAKDVIEARCDRCDPVARWAEETD